MKLVNITYAKAQLSKLLDEVSKGRRVVIGRAGRPIATLTAYRGSGHIRKPNVLKGKIKISSDFEDLPDEISEAFGVVK